MSTWRCGWICPRSYLFAAVFLAGALSRSSWRASLRAEIVGLVVSVVPACAKVHLWRIDTM